MRRRSISLNGDGTISSDEDFYAAKDTLTAAIADDRYPSPPARPLYLVTKGQPDGAAAEFIQWVLTEGQAFVDVGGYIGVNEDQLQAGLNMLQTTGQFFPVRLYSDLFFLLHNANQE